MASGVILDKSAGANLVQRWIAAKASRISKSGPVLPKTLKGLECRLVETYRCRECGFLKSYASDPIDAPGWFTR